MSELIATDGSQVVTSAEEQLVTLTVDNQVFGIPILAVQDIVEPLKITPVPLAPSAVAGVMNLRGRIVNVIDLRHCLGDLSYHEIKHQMGVTVEYHNNLYTLLVDKIGDVVAVEQTLIEKAPATLSESLRRLCKGIIRRKENLLVVLDVDKILDPETIFNTPTTTRKRRKVDHYKPVEKKLTIEVKERKPETNDGEPTDPEGDSPKESASNSASRSIFDRIGGEIGVHGAVSLLSNRLLEDPQLESSISASNIEQIIATFVGLLTKRLGGPNASFMGNSIEDALADSRISPAHLNDIVHHLRAALEVMEMPAELVEEVLAAL
jgi:chemotaxis signal transduction protein/truncated hemoglobin YjbI